MKSGKCFGLLNKKLNSSDSTNDLDPNKNKSNIVLDNFLNSKNKNNLPGNLEIVLWNHTKTKKLLKFECQNPLNYGSNTKKNNEHLMKIQNGEKNVNTVGKIGISFMKTQSKNLDFKFDFKTMHSSRIDTKSTIFGKTLNWKESENNLNFNLFLGQETNKKDPDELSSVKSQENKTIIKKFQQNKIRKKNIFDFNKNFNVQPSDNNVTSINNYISNEPKKQCIFTQRFGLRKRPAPGFTPIKTNFENLKNLENLLFKLFMNIEFVPSDLNLNMMEKEIIRLIFSKKKFNGYTCITFDCQFFNEARKTIMKKKTEDGLKYIFKKAIKQLKKSFFTNSESLKHHKLSVQEKDYVFYQHYYGVVSEIYGKPLECFFHFRNWKQRTNPHIPKSVTKQYVSDLKLNPMFVAKIEDYLKYDFFKSFKRLNRKKIKQMVFKWEQMFHELGFARARAQIGRQLNSRGTKLPWTDSEMTFALSSSLKLLSDH
jgi:hypothetical protein